MSKFDKALDKFVDFALKAFLGAMGILGLLIAFEGQVFGGVLILTLVMLVTVCMFTD